MANNTHEVSNIVSLRDAPKAARARVQVEVASIVVEVVGDARVLVCVGTTVLLPVSFRFSIPRSIFLVRFSTLPSLSHWLISTSWFN